MAIAVLMGSLGSGGGGARDVFTEQNIQPRVHVSPSIMMVAVANSLSLPPQHSPIFGHRASSQTYKYTAVSSKNSFSNVSSNTDSINTVHHHRQYRIFSTFAHKAVSLRP